MKGWLPGLEKRGRVKGRLPGLEKVGVSEGPASRSDPPELAHHNTMPLL